MLKKQVTYTDYDDVKRTEEFRFNLNKIELIALDAACGEEGLERKIRRLAQSPDKNKQELFNFFQDLIRASYGVKSEDGKSFRKSAELSAQFMQSEAYVVLFDEITSSAEAAAAFVNGIIPQNLKG